MKKVKILTFHFADNYGALLQAYALKKYLEEREMEVEFINYIPGSERYFYEINPLKGKGIKGKIKKLLEFGARYDSKIRFDDFREVNLNIKKEQPLNFENCDLLIVGSDQVWNEKIVKDLRPYLFSDVGRDSKKISYAASIGCNDFADETKELFKKYLKDFEAVSVRERTAELALAEMGISSTTVVDPVFLLDKMVWKDIALKPRNFLSDKPYILMYLLREDSASIKKANDFAKNNNMEVYYIHPLGKKMKNLNGKYVHNVGPREFLWLIDNAHVVFTNSFHAVSFSIILESKFYHFSHSQLGDRVKNLLEMFECKDAGESIKECELKSKKYELIRKSSMMFLEKNISE